MEIREIIGKLTLEEKAGLCSGADFWRTKAVERLGIPRMMVSDGPHGLRKQRDEGDHVGINDSIEAVCFPTGATAAASFDRQLMREMGESVVSVLLRREGQGGVPGRDLRGLPLLR